MQTYETLFVTVPTLTDEEERQTVENLSQIVTDGGGSLVANERMGRRRLAYPVQKQTDGVYVRFLYDAEPAVPKELERRIRLSDRILRVLTVRLEQNWAEAAKVQAVRDAEARAEAAERQAQEEAERARLEAEGEEAAEKAGADATEDAPVEDVTTDSRDPHGAESADAADPIAEKEE